MTILVILKGKFKFKYKISKKIFIIIYKGIKDKENETLKNENSFLKFTSDIKVNLQIL